MKKTILTTCILIFTTLFLSAQKTDFPRLTGPYLGQKPPGMTPEIFAPGILSIGNHELDITCTSDGNEIFFTRSGQDWYSAILEFKRVDGEWIGPIMPEFSGKYQNNYPFVTPSGDKIYFNSQEPAVQAETNKSNNNIFIANKTVSGWSTGNVIEPSVVIDGTESFVSVAGNGNIYFGAKYKDGLGGSDLYMCEFKNGSYSKAVNLGKSINSEHNEFHCYVALDESYLLFDANRPKGFGANDLYISFKLPDGSWGNALNLGSIINTEYSESRPYISPDGKFLFFCSNRLSAPEDNHDKKRTYKEFQNRIDGPGNGNQDIYWVSAKIIEELRPKEY